MSRGVVRIHFNRAAKFLLRLGEIHFEKEQISERRVAFGGCVIQRDSMASRGVGFWKIILRRTSGEQRNQHAGISYTGIGGSIIRIGSRRFFKVIERHLQVLTGAFIPEKAALEVKLISLGVFGWTRGNGPLFGTCQFGLERRGDSLRDVTLHG